MRRLLYIVALVAGAIVLYLVYSKWPKPDPARSATDVAAIAVA